MPTTENDTLTILVPAYNEEGSIEDTVRELHLMAKQADAKILVINDGSSDWTGEILANLLG